MNYFPLDCKEILVILNFVTSHRPFHLLSYTNPIHTHFPSITTVSPLLFTVVCMSNCTTFFFANSLQSTCALIDVTTCHLSPSSLTSKWLPTSQTRCGNGSLSGTMNSTKHLMKFACWLAVVCIQCTMCLHFIVILIWLTNSITI
jgi:hypothetical protein